MINNSDNKLKDYFDETAEEFSEFYQKRPSFKERYSVFEKHVTELLRNMGGTGRWCMDVGCGDGILSRMIARQGCHVIGVDQSATMIKLAREQAEKEMLSERMSYIQASFLGGLEVFSGKCDLIIASSVLEYIEDLSGALNEISRLLKKGGYLLASIPNRWSFFRILERNVKIHFVSENSYLKYQKHQLGASEFKSIARRAGFAYVDHEYFGAWDFAYRLISRHRNVLFGNLCLMVLKKG